MKTVMVVFEQLVQSVGMKPYYLDGAVAKRLGRRSIGYELSREYCALAVKRVEKETMPMNLCV